MVTDPMTVNERISLAIEPPESLPEITVPKRASSSFPQVANFRPHELSPGKGWRVGPGMKWRERNWLTDESANAMLLDLMPEPNLWIESGLGEPKQWGCCADMNASAESFVMNPDRKTAIAQAFLSWKESEVIPQKGER